MYQELLKEWLETDDGKELTKMMGVLSRNAVRQFAKWLDSRGLTLREPEPAFAGAVKYCQHISENIDGTCPYCDLPKPPRS